MKLDISSVQPTSTVTLRLFGRLSDTRAPNVTDRHFSALEQHVERDDRDVE